jgi:hypothetical protein
MTNDSRDEDRVGSSNALLDVRRRLARGMPFAALVVILTWTIDSPAWIRVLATAGFFVGLGLLLWFGRQPGD